MKTQHNQRISSSELLRRSSELLENMYDEERALFSYSTSIDGDGYRNDWSDAGAVMRYTVNNLAAIERAVDLHDDLSWDFERILERFLSAHLDAVTNPADQGLLLATLVEAGHERQTDLLARIVPLVNDSSRLQGMTLQDMGWLLIGLSTLARSTGRDEHRALATRVYTTMRDSFLGSNLLPSYSLAPMRRRFTSFGGIVYYLMSLHTYGSLCDDCEAITHFSNGVERVIRLQGTRGEWPWFMDARRCGVLDWYQVYSVHQHSMSMLFLLPAFDLGLPGVGDAIQKSYRWIFGDNELNASMVVDKPFLIYRSIRRNESSERARRLLRSSLLAYTNGKGETTDRSRLVINTECRSYEMGWIVYAWAGREDFQEFTAMQLAQHSIHMG